MKMDNGVKAMISSSELLSDETRDGLEELLGCKEFNRYSNQKCAVSAQSDLHNKNMHINNASYYIEVLDIDKDAPVQDGEVGRIVVTDLFNYAMPLIRYDTGDLGTISTYSGKRAFSTIQGRRVDLIYDTKGRPLTPHTWSVYMWKFNKLKQYQFIQENKKEYVLKVNGAKGIYEKEEFELLLKEHGHGGEEMKLKNAMLVVTDIDRTVEFYKKVLGLHVIMDFGANKTLTGGLSLQTAETYGDFIGTDEISFGSNSFELYFEEDDFDKFAEKLKTCDVEYVHPVLEHTWGQRVVRFYDPDKHIIEVGENMKVVCRRFLDSGMTPEQVAERMDVPMKFVNACMR